MVVPAWVDRTIATTVVSASDRYDNLLRRHSLSRSVDGRVDQVSVTEDRDVVRRHASARRSSDAPAPARKASRHYSVGDEVETTEIIEEFPETVYREAPSVRPYRYFRQENSVILVDPEDHRVVDVFD